jgi:phosphatidylserine/phosphatidylglycerophosphate/cardiolipin synthase-like enzyme
MAIDLKVYDNGDHTALVWLPTGGKIQGCLGFTVRRLLKRQGTGSEDFLHGFVGFSDDQPFDKAAPWKFPLQRYLWWDYHVSPGDEVQYSVIPVVGSDKDHIQLSSADASALTPPMTITGQATPKIAAYFNKGIVSAQWVARALGKLGPKPNIKKIIGTPGDELRNALGGLLRPQILALLKQTKDNNGEIFAALYELNDPELKDALKALGKKCHLILANGAFKPPGNDENAEVRKELRNVVDLHDRLVTGNHFAHNKFVVFCDSGGNPQRVLSGSTNWTMTGLCTQANNGIVVDSPELAENFLDEWKLLKDAGNGYPPVLAQTNSTAKSFDIDGGRITQWFVPTTGGQDLDFARKLINGAKDGILFLFFNPGKFVPAEQPASKWTLLQNILFRHHEGTENFDANLYIRGVVNQAIDSLTNDTAKHAIHDPTETPVSLFDGGKDEPQRLGFESMVPKNIKDVFHNWRTEILGAGVHIHSKVVVIDPFGDHPVVMTGSHNLGFKASHSNDDNLMIIEGNAPLAASYAANIIAIYQAYRWNAYVEAHRQDPKGFHALALDDSWQDGHLKNEIGEIKFWLGSHQAVVAAAASAPTQPASGDAPARAAVATGPGPDKKKAPAKKKTPVKKQAAAKRKTAAKKKKVAKKKPAAKKKPKKKVAKKKRPAKKTKKAKKSKKQ